jgi:hypothetical protein
MNISNRQNDNVDTWLTAFCVFFQAWQSCPHLAILTNLTNLAILAILATNRIASITHAFCASNDHQLDGRHLAAGQNAAVFASCVGSQRQHAPHAHGPVGIASQ